MLTERRAILLLRLILILLFGELLLFQIFSLPGQFAHMARENPEHAYLRWPLTAVTIFWVLCAQTVVVATWRLLDLVQTERIFTSASRRWVDAIVWAITAAFATLVAVLAYFAPTFNDPGLPLLLLLLTMGVAALGLLLIVLRGLLRRATTLQTDMEHVI